MSLTVDVSVHAAALPVGRAVSRRYCLITPCRDEATFARRTLASVVGQTVPPTRWIVVDDGSTDDTPAIVEEYARTVPYIQLIRRADRGHRRLVPGSSRRSTLGSRPSISRLRVHLQVRSGPRPAARLLRGTDAPDGSRASSGHHVRQALVRPSRQRRPRARGLRRRNVRRHDQVLSTTCFTEIGGFVPQVMWDGIDCHRARMLGWMAESVDDEALRFVHLRPQGASQKGIWTGRTRAGFGQYFMGTAPLYYLASAGYRASSTPSSSAASPCSGATRAARCGACHATAMTSSDGSCGSTSTRACTRASGGDRRVNARQEAGMARRASVVQPRRRS